jgi:hypothetical protein
MGGKVEGVVGYPVTLPCDITPPTPGNPSSLLLGQIKSTDEAQYNAVLLKPTGYLHYNPFSINLVLNLTLAWN